MQHLDPDRLVLLALSEDPADPGESAHLTECPGCRSDLETFRHVAAVGAEGEELRDLPPPPERIWRAIEADLIKADPLKADPLAGDPVEVDLREAGSAAGPGQHATVIDFSAARHREPPRRSRRWLAPAIAAAAAAVISVVGTVAVIRFAQAPSERIMARATLSPLPTVAPTAGGTARMLADGEMRIVVRNLPLTTGFHEVWLIDPDDTTKMITLGNLPDKSDAVLPVPPGTDLNRYRLVDVSDEAHDGDAAHSGHSLLRGTLSY